MKLKDAVDSYMQKVPEVKVYGDRCLKTERWDSNIILMIVDAAFTSIGLNYFQTVAPKVEMFSETFITTGKVQVFEDLLSTHNDELEKIWRNKRSWHMAKSVISYLVAIKNEHDLDDRSAFIKWAEAARLENWEKDPIGKIKGVGINTFQYLRMMGGVNTVMPDKIVKRVIGEMLSKVNMQLPSGDIEFVRLMDRIATETGYRAIDMCWMTWLIQSEAGLIRTKKYSALLHRI